MKKYEVIEDNGGGLTLVVFGEDGKAEYMNCKYEYAPKQLLQDLEALKNGSDPIAEDWDNNMEDPQKEYDSTLSYECGWEIIAKKSF